MNKNQQKAIDPLDQAQVLVTALPYIQRWAGKTIVIKYGGNAMISPELKDAVMRDIVLLRLVGIHVVLVHGGGPEINQMVRRIGLEPRFVGGLRYTDADTMEIVQMVLAGKVNKNLVQLLEGHGGRAIGLCGLDGSMIKAEKHAGDVDMGFLGDVTEVNVTPIEDTLAAGYIPVVASMGAGPDQTVYNINADTAAAQIAAAMKAEKLILMTDVKGLLRDVKDDESLIPVVNVSEVVALKRDGIIKGGMIPKVDCCVEAVRRGVNRAHIIDGRIPHAILVETLSDEGVGTMFC